MKAYYYHLRTKEKNEPRLTRCVLKDENGIAIGTSLCGYSDFPNKKDGRARAFGRALAALRHRKNLFPISREEAIDILINVDADDLDYSGKSTRFDRDYKGLYFEDLDLLNELERKLLKEL